MTRHAGQSVRARIQRAARSLRLHEPTVALATLGPEEGTRDCWTLELTLTETDHPKATVYDGV